jgi:hypothetical protein
VCLASGVAKDNSMIICPPLIKLTVPVSVTVSILLFDR